MKFLTVTLLFVGALALSALIVDPPACRPSVDISGFKIFGC